MMTQYAAALPGAVVSAGALIAPGGQQGVGGPAYQIGTGLTLNTGTTPSTLQLTTPVVVANGGTGTVSLAANGVLVGNGTSPITASSALTWNGTTLAVTGGMTLSTPLPVASGGTGAATTAGAPFVQRAGDTMTGGLTVPSIVLGAPPSGALGTGTINSTGQHRSTFNVSPPQPGLPAAVNFLAVGQDGQNTVIAMDGYGSNTPYLLSRAAAGTAAAPTALVNGQWFSAWIGNGYGASAYGGNNTAIHFVAKENWTATAQGSQIEFATTPIGTNSGVISLQLQGNTATFSGNVISNGQYSTTGGSAGYSFDDRGNPGNNWVWYSTSLIARLWHGGGDLMTVDTNGNLEVNNVIFGPGATVPSPIQPSHVISRDGATLVLTSDGGDNTSLCSNVYLGPGPTWRYLTAGSATMFQVVNNVFAWYYAPSGAAGASCSLSNIAQLDSGGNLIVGANLQLNASGATQALLILNQASRNWRIISNPGDGGYYVQDFTAGQLNRIHVDTSGNCTSSSSWGAISDASLKTDIRDHDRGLADVLKLRPRRFRYNGKGGLEGEGAGLIAQELAEVMPELVRDFALDENTTVQAVVETGVIWPLLKAVQQLAAKVEALEAASAR